MTIHLRIWGDPSRWPDPEGQSGPQHRLFTDLDRLADADGSVPGSLRSSSGYHWETEWINHCHALTRASGWPPQLAQRRLVINEMGPGRGLHERQSTTIAKRLWAWKSVSDV